MKVLVRSLDTYLNWKYRAIPKQPNSKSQDESRKEALLKLQGSPALHKKNKKHAPEPSLSLLHSFWLHQDTFLSCGYWTNYSTLSNKRHGSNNRHDYQVTQHKNLLHTLNKNFAKINKRHVTFIQL